MRTLDKTMVSESLGIVHKIDKNAAFDAYCAGCEVIGTDMSQNNKIFLSKKRNMLGEYGIQIRFKQFCEALNIKHYFLTEQNYRKYCAS